MFAYALASLGTRQPADSTEYKERYMPFRGCLANYDLFILLRLSRDNSRAALHAFYS